MVNHIGVYLRVSTLGQNTELQRFEIENYLKSRGWMNWTVYEDRLSGTTRNRPALKQMLIDARSRKIDLIICWKLDRMYRSLKDLVSTLQELNEIGVTFISLKDQIDQSTSSGRLMIHLLASFAEFEASLIKERVIAGLQNAKRNGVRLGRPQTVNVDDVRLLHERGLSLGQIAKRLSISKSAVHKTLKQGESTKSVNNSESIVDQALDIGVQETEVKSTREK